MKNIKLLKLYRHPTFLPPVGWSHNSNPTGKGQDIPRWWKKANIKLRKEVLSERKLDEDISAVCLVIAELSNVTIFCHSFNLKSEWYSNPQVVANKDIKESIKLKKGGNSPSKGDMVYAEWLDATLNPTPATVDEVRNSFGLIKVGQLGFLMHKNKSRVFIGGRYNATHKKYRHLEAIPTVNITKMVCLRG
jgi:hypothetical protein